MVKYMKKIRIILWILFLLSVIQVVFGMVYRNHICYAVSGGLLLVFIILVAVIDVRVLLPLEHAVKDILDTEEEDGFQDSSFVKNESGHFLKLLNLAVYKHENSKRDPEGAKMFQKQTELMALQSQINPHFLYNTLDTIRGQALLDQNLQVASMVEKLSSFFRYSISGKENMVMLRDEIYHTINYINIQQFRFGNRFVFDVEVDDEEENCMNYLVPRLFLQPVVENAIFHGLEDVNEGGSITLDVTLVAEEMIIMVSDNGKGMSVTDLDDLNDRIHSAERTIAGHNNGTKDHTGIALPNINRRIKLLFGDAYGLSVFSSLSRGTDVEIVLPVIDGTKEEWNEEYNIEGI